MPGWYIHSEVAKTVAEQLSSPAGLPPDLNFNAADAQQLGDLCHKWRNFLAIGAVGPDMFYLLPDYADGLGNVIMSVAQFLLDLWTTVDDVFVGSWEKWMGPVGANDQDLTALLTGDLSNQLAQALSEVSSALLNAEETLVTRSGDLFGLLTSGVPQGFADTGLYWSDMFHYRKTYAYPAKLWELANTHLADAAAMEAQLTAGGHVPTDDEQMAVDDARNAAESEIAFALGWMTHCATDVTGHPFTNAKCGGPFRLQWQRHHLVENHFDAAAYNEAHAGAATYEELGTSALHFRVAFRTKTAAPYNGARFAPMYDYFTGFPPYNTDETNIGDELRTRFFDVDPGDLPEHLSALIIEAMGIYGTDPALLNDSAKFSDAGSGRPNSDALQIMWEIFFRYWKLISSSGLHPRKPMPPPLIAAHPFPTPPGGALPAEDDARGGDPRDDTGMHGGFNLFDALAAVLAWLKYIGQVVQWLLTVLPGMALDVATFPAREFLYYTVIGPLWSLYMASRKLLVLSGFLTPKPEEIEDGLITQGHGTTFMRTNLALDLADPLGFAATSTTFDEPSGRTDSLQEWSADRAFPRQTVKDTLPQVNQFLSLLGLPVLTGAPGTGDASQWVAPWLYPMSNLAGQRVGWEPDLVHVGPWVQGSMATELIHSRATDLGAARHFEQAESPMATAKACADHLPNDKHLGNPLDYSLYVISRLTAGDVLPDFNLDSDRGYAWHCWEWTRHMADPAVIPQSTDDFLIHRVTDSRGFPVPARLDFQQPCTPPEQFQAAWAANHDPAREPVNSYRPTVALKVAYLDAAAADGCSDLTSVTSLPTLTGDDEESRRAGMRTDGTDLP